MPSYKLIYFDGRGRGEIARLLFAAGGIKYEDHRIPPTAEAWGQFKPKTLMGQLPMLEVDGTMICQSLAIARLIAKEAGTCLAGQTDLEQARADMIVDGVEDLGTKMNQIFKEKDESKKVSNMPYQGHDFEEAQFEEKKKEFAENTIRPAMVHFEKLASSDGYFVGNSLTWADVAFYSKMLFLGGEIGDDPLKGHVNLNKVRDNVTSNPGIAKWVKERPETPW
ncbi:HPGDS [Branchiostoma lanceolatum]|uniref:glutathione transferase n=1 Tax=Branchiostoma lanceolatum TaxID=7740 RepID=A0A8J9Z844_BRALA|nr:HPGDS [Branchiostoma lanceolatum]